MKLLFNPLFAAAVLSATSSAGALAQQQSAAPADASATAGKVANPNEVVCEKQEETGSRLATRKVCMTRAQWADLKGQDRQEIERVQTQRGQLAPH
jgi:invasion protein IalB